MLSNLSNRFKILIFFTAISLLHVTNFFAQDTITKAEMSTLYEAYQKSSMYSYGLALARSTVNDTAAVKDLLSRIDPYYVLFESENAKRPDSFLSKLSVSANTKELFLAAYVKAYNEPKSEAYKKFQAMGDEDQRIRNMMDKCGDTAICSKLVAMMMKTDSAHATYLYHYVKQHGFPTMHDGSMYATILAIHDHNNHKFYMPYLKKGVMQGDVILSAVELLDFYIGRNKVDLSLLEKLKGSNVFWFDVSEVLNDQLPASLPRIQKTVRKLCGSEFYLYYIFECKNRKIEEDWVNTKAIPLRERYIGRLEKELVPDCKKQMVWEAWGVQFAPSNRTKLKLAIVPMKAD